MSWRYILTRPDGAGNEPVIHWDVPLADPKITNTLSGPDALSGTISPEIASLKAPDGQPLIVPWGTALYAEQDGAIRCGGIVTDARYRNDDLAVDATGFAGYPQGMPYLDSIVFRSTDPAAICTHIWAYLQSQRGGNLGVVTKFAPTPVRTGAVTSNESPQPRNADTGRYENDDVPKALEMSPDKTVDLGQVIDELAASAPFDYVESHRWDGEKIIHEVRSTYPLIGRRRHDLRFVTGENVYVIPDVLDLGEEYASEVYLMGAGEGSLQPKARISRPGETRLRRVSVVTDKSITNTAQLTARARIELNARAGIPTIEDIAIIEHPHAPLGSIGLGDEVLLRIAGDAGWQSNLERWVRVLQINYTPEDPSKAVLKVATVTGA